MIKQNKHNEHRVSPIFKMQPHKGFITPEQDGWENVLFYGDSITWGMSHDDTYRYAVTWPQMLAKRLAPYKLRIVESALCSRTTVHDDGDNWTWMHGARAHHFNGLHHFLPEFSSCNPKWLILLLGTNDLKSNIRLKVKERTRVDAMKIATNCAKIALKAREIHEASPFHSGKLQILMVAPPRINLVDAAVELGYDEISDAIATEFTSAYETVAEANGFHFVAPECDMSSSRDGIHVTVAANSVVADAVWNEMKRHLGRAILPSKNNQRVVSQPKPLVHKRKREAPETPQPQVVPKRRDPPMVDTPASTPPRVADPTTTVDKMAISSRYDAEVTIIEFLHSLGRSLPQAVYMEFLNNFCSLPCLESRNCIREVKRARSILVSHCSNTVLVTQFDTILDSKQ